MLRNPGGALSIERLQIPELHPGQALVEIAWSGVCGSQLLETRGLRGEDPWIPHTLGHEGSGIVIEVGEGVEKVAEGDRVVVTWIRGSGADVPSARYSSNGETVNSGAVSTFMEHAVVSENRLVPIPAEVPLREAALLGCALPTGAGMILNTAGVPEGASVGIFGVGGVGMGAVAGAALASAVPIVAIDLQAARLGRALAAGATHAVNASEGSVEERIGELTDRSWLDFAIECSGTRQGMETAYACANPASGLVVLAGNLPAGERIEIDPFDLIRGKRIVGSWGGGTEPDRDLPRYSEMLTRDRLDLEPMLGAEYELPEVDRALADLEQGAPGRPLLRLR